jgi:hypothetical protein
VSTARDRARFKTLLDEIFTSFEATDATAALPGFIGQAEGEPLEHTTRRYVIDGIVEGLGWQLGTLSRNIIEEARVRGTTMLRMDYAGVNASTLQARLILEAKAWDKPFARASDVARRRGNVPATARELLAKAIEHYKERLDLAGSPVIAEWAESIQQLHAYVTAVFKQSGHRVARVAITSGQWLVIFTDPYTTFGGPIAVDPSTILLFEGRQIIEQSDLIYDLLARSALVPEPPHLIEPTQVSNWASLGEIARSFRALWIARRKDGAHFSPYPQINLYPALVIECCDQRLITVVDKQAQQLIPHQRDELPKHFAAVAAASDGLVARIGQQLGGNVRPAPLAGFPGFPEVRTLGVDNGVSSRKSFVKPWSGPNEFLVVTGESSHYLLANPSIHPCGGHNWASCQSLGLHHPANAIIERSFEPAAFFITNEPHHCAHREIHHRRDDRCQIGAFEEFLCCRACLFERVCWAELELAGLPCGVSPAQSAVSAAKEPAQAI